LSRQAVQSVINRALADSEFRQELFAKPHQALTEYDLTEAEVAALRTIDVETLESLARRPDEHSSDSLVTGLYTGMLAANRRLRVTRGKDLSGLEEDVQPRESTTQVAVRKQWIDLEESTRKEVRTMKRYQILVTIVAMLAVGLAGYAVGASRQPTGITVTVEPQLASRSLGIGDTEDEAGEAPSMELGVEEVPGIGFEGDYTDGGWDDSFYQPVKVHIEWQVEPFPYVEEWDRAPNREPAAKEIPGVGLEGDYFDGGWDDSFYQPLKVHIEWNVDDPSDEPWY
jgi:hypothetical protein